VEKTAIESALKEHHGEINATFQALGISRRALYERMKKYGLDKVEFR
jgi:DNA-binding NtrC family response regulator